MVLDHVGEHKIFDVFDLYDSIGASNSIISNDDEALPVGNKIAAAIGRDRVVRTLSGEVDRIVANATVYFILSAAA